MTAVAVIAHKGKNLDGGLPELRKALAARGVRDPQWHEVEKSREAPEQVKRALKDGAELIFAWGGDGMVQRCVDALAKSKAASRSCLPGRPICSPRTSGSRTTSRAPSTSASPASTASSMSVT